MTVTKIPWEYVTEHASGRVNIACPAATLTRDGATDDPPFEGPVIIRSAEGGGFGITMFPRGADSTSTLKSVFDGIGKGTPGRVLPPDAYSALAATDLRGHLWSTRIAYPNVSFGTSGVVANAPVSGLECVQGEADVSSTAVHLFFEQSLGLQWNAVTRTTEDVGGSEPRLMISRNRAEIAVGDLVVQVRESSEGITIVSARTEGLAIPALESRILEALRFITLRPLSPIAVDRACPTGRVWTLLSKRAVSGSFLQPPLEKYDSPYWSLFEKYLRRVLGHADAESFHPLSSALNQLIYTNGATIESVALSLGVTVEGVLKVVRASKSSAPEAVMAQVRRLEEAILATPDVSPEISKRAIGSLSGLKSIRAADQLRELMERGVITDRHVKSWTALRNAAAHAERTTHEDLDGLLDKCHTVYEMLLRIVYLDIGYDGAFRRYAERNWPLSSENWPPARR